MPRRFRNGIRVCIQAMWIRYCKRRRWSHHVSDVMSPFLLMRWDRCGGRWSFMVYTIWAWDVGAEGCWLGNYAIKSMPLVCEAEAVSWENAYQSGHPSHTVTMFRLASTIQVYRLSSPRFQFPAIEPARTNSNLEPCWARWPFEKLEPAGAGWKPLETGNRSSHKKQNSKLLCRAL